MGWWVVLSWCCLTVFSLLSGRQFVVSGYVVLSRRWLTPLSLVPSECGGMLDGKFASGCRTCVHVIFM